MEEAFLRKLDYRTLQRMCVDEHIKAVGSRDTLITRLIEHFFPTIDTIEKHFHTLSVKDNWWEFKPSTNFVLEDDPVLIYYLGWVIGTLLYKYPNLSDLRQVIEKHKKHFPHHMLTNEQYVQICNPILTWFRQLIQNHETSKSKDILNEALDGAADKLDEWNMW